DGPTLIGRVVRIARCPLLTAHDVHLRGQRPDDVGEGEAVVRRRDLERRPGDHVPPSVVTGPRFPQDVPSTSRSTAIGSSVFEVMRDIHGIIGRAGLQPPCFGLLTRRVSEGKWKLLTPSLEARWSAPETRVARVGQRPGMTAEGSPV